MSETSWSEKEKIIAKEALQKAYELEIENLIAEIRSQAGAIVKIEDVWLLHDFLSAKRHEIDGKYDHRDSMLFFVLSRLLKERLLQIEDLEGLDKDKLVKIAVLTRM